jgi:hypothetical protein
VGLLSVRFSFGSWPPSRAEFFRAASPRRPLFQGDVFEDVPYVKVMAGDRPEADPKIASERRTIMLLGYPCDIYTQGALAKVQTIAIVREAEKLRVPEDWRGAFTVCPLPDLHEDGRLWAVDFRTMGTADRFYLDTAKRIACLSEFGWAYLRQRLAVYHTRVAVHLDDCRAAGRATWEEIELWEQWNELSHPTAQFQGWLDTFDPGIGFTHRQALERGMTRLVASALLGVEK